MDDSKDGLVGLENLGNTCYLNSTLQCLSNTFELTQFFLQSVFKVDLIQINDDHQESKLQKFVLSYAKTIDDMWNMNQSAARPDLFKQIFGTCAQ